jgi:hypothetical protein
MPAAAPPSKPLPAARAALSYDRRFDSAEHARLTKGLAPSRVEDKWTVTFEGGWLTFRRRWTGICIYALRLEPSGDGDGSTAVEAWVNRSRDEYTVSDVAYDARMLAYLVDHLLLGRDAPFPYPPAIEGTSRTDLFRQVVDGTPPGKSPTKRK